MLKQWKQDNRYTWEQLAQMIGISRMSLMDIINNRSPKIKVSTCLKIKQITGLEPWEYLDGLEAFKKINSK